MNERGQMSVETFIGLAIGVVILVLAIIALTGGFGNLNPFISQSNNVNTISTQCLAACTTNSVYDFCSRTFTINSGTTTVNNATCNFLSNPISNQAQYGISPCTALPCSNIVIVSATTLSALQSQCSAIPGKTLQALVGNTVQSVNC
jgi:hypothetical protein